jgi:hypothetical protein
MNRHDFFVNLSFTQHKWKKPQAQTPNTQTPNKLQAPNLKTRYSAGFGFEAWNLSLFGVWGLVFGILFGVWCLVFGVWCLLFEPRYSALTLL